MTDVLDRLDPPVPIEVGADHDTALDGRSARTAFAALAAGAAVIHVAMAPPHVADSFVLGLGFVAAAWAQLATAWLGVTRPSRRLWLGAVALNVALLGVWAVSRTAGLPFGEHSGHAESTTIVDLTTVGLELAAIVVAVTLLARRGGRSVLLGIGIPIVAVVAASGALASPDARTHAHGDHAAMSGHDHDETDVAAGDHDHAALADLGFGSFMNGHEHAHVDLPLDAATQTELDRQLAITREVAAQYPTLQDAVDDGYRRAGPYVPGLGLHLVKYAGEGYFNPDGVTNDDDLRHPLSLLYLSEVPDADLTGFMYYSSSPVEPAGFAGRNDGWHYHESLCAVSTPAGLDFPYGPDFGATKAQCDAVGGYIIPQTGWMVHVWTVPEYDDMADHGGVFAEMNPRLGCSDGTYFIVSNEQWLDNPYNVCVSGASAQLDA